MKIDKSKLKNNNGYFSGNQLCIEKQTATRAMEYKKRVAGSYLAINGSQIKSYMPEGEYFVTRKIDGEMQVIFFNGEDIFTVNGYGNVKTGLACFEELKDRLKELKFSSCILAGELHVDEKDGRKRVYDLLKALGSEGDKNTLNLSLFDILEIDGKQYEAPTYAEKHARLAEISGNCEKVKTVEMTVSATKDDLVSVFDKWQKENAEGVVVHGNFPRIYKIKPKHNFDVAVVGYSESDEKGKIRSLLVALMTSENAFQVIGKAGTGYDDNQRMIFFDRLSKMHADSQYIETDSNNVAFHMVRPEIVIEISCTDILTELSGESISNALIEYKDGAYVIEALMNGISLLFPVYERIRDDKTVNKSDVRWEQIEGLVFIDHKTSQPLLENLPKSEIISREIYRKEFKGKTMLQKFIVWKTNKDQADRRFAAYVFNYTNFSPDRKDPLDREIRISNNLEQITAIKNSYIEENIKKGWEKA
jgi:hypothetical protein